MHTAHGVQHVFLLFPVNLMFIKQADPSLNWVRSGLTRTFELALKIIMSLVLAVPAVLAVAVATADADATAASMALDLLLVQCESATLVVQDGKYYGMRLLMPGQTEPIHPRIIVSATHKWMRQKKSAQLVFMLGCFYSAVSKDSDNASRGSFMGHVTRIQNRFAITILEEGGMQFLDKTAQQQVVSAHL